MKRPVLLEVEWVDSTLLEAKWYDTDVFRDAAETTILSVGFRVGVHNGFLYLAGNWNQSPELCPWSAITVIPERCIVKKRRLKARQRG